MNSGALSLRDSDGDVYTPHLSNGPHLWRTVILKLICTIKCSFLSLSPFQWIVLVKYYTSISLEYLWVGKREKSWKNWGVCQGLQTASFGAEISLQMYFVLHSWWSPLLHCICLATVHTTPCYPTLHPWLHGFPSPAWLLMVLNCGWP